MHPAIPELAARLAGVPEVDRVVLFGSRARGDADERSDIDLAVSCPRATPAVWRVVREEVERARTLLFIDVVRLDAAPPVLRRNVLREGVTLYERP